MAKFNGTCSGSSAAKYDVWLYVKQNSQDIENNKSNITVKLNLQRNDGYSDSAYNHNESSNSAAIKVNNETKVSKTLAIDTRNGVVVTLASWTGDVSHKDDGTLSLDLSGSFTISGTSLTGGKVTAEFTCTDIPRASTLTIAGSSVVPGGSFTFGISGVSSFKHKITCKIGSKVSQSDSFAAGTAAGTITIPEKWAEYVTDEKKTAITVVLATYKSSKLIGSRRYSITFKIPDTAEYKPSFDVALTESGAPEGWNVYLKGISKLTVSIENQAYKAGASLKNISIKFDGLTKRKNNSVFETLNAGEKEVVVRVTDSRGYYTEVTKTITVCDYFPPSIKIESVHRCDESGEKKTDGSYLLVNYTSRFCDVTVDDVALNTETKSYSIRKKGSTTVTEEGEVTEVSPIIIGAGNVASQSGYEIVMAISDNVTGDDDTFTIGTLGIPFNIKKGGNGAAFGCYAENDNELLVAWNLKVLGDLVYERLTVNQSDELISEVRGVARWFPCLQVVFVRMRFKLAKNLEADKNYTIGTFADKIPSLYTPLNISIGTSAKQRGSAAIASGTGELIISSDSDISSGTYIYISGTYFAYRETE